MKKYRILITLIFAALILTLFLRTYLLDNKLKVSHEVLCGTITSLVTGKSGGHLIKYEYTYNGKIFRHDWGCGQETYNRYRQGIKSIFVVIEKKNPINSNILENRGDFEKFRIVPQDTTGISCN